MWIPQQPRVGRRALGEEVAETRQKTGGAGEVNLAAIAESHEIEERLTFLTEQEADLKKAVDSLYCNHQCH